MSVDGAIDRHRANHKIGKTSPWASIFSLHYLLGIAFIDCEFSVSSF